MKILFMLLSLAIMLFAIFKHRLPGNRNFYLVAYWKSLSAKGTMIYTAGLILLFLTIIF